MIVKLATTRGGRAEAGLERRLEELNDEMRMPACLYTPNEQRWVSGTEKDPEWSRSRTGEERNGHGDGWEGGG